MTRKSDPVRAYLSTIGKAGGEASGASRRLAREKLDAGSMSEEERWAYEMRREQARQAARVRWSKVKPGG